MKRLGKLIGHVLPRMPFFAGPPMRNAKPIVASERRLNAPVLDQIRNKYWGAGAREILSVSRGRCHENATKQKRIGIFEKKLRGGFAHTKGGTSPGLSK